MKNILKVQILSALLVAMPLGAMATPVTFFSDTFTNGSTLNSATPADPTPTNTAYELIANKAWNPNPPTMTASDLKFGIAATTSGYIQAHALFATNVVALAQVGDFVQLTVVFTNTSGLLTAAGQLGFGLFNSGQVKPIAGGINNGVPATFNGFAQNWSGYNANINFSGAASRISTRPAQSGSTIANQDLFTFGTSSSYASGAVIGTATGNTTLIAGSTYTEVLTITLNAASSLTITNTLYAGPNTSGTVITNFGAVATNTTFLTSGFDSLVIGYCGRGNTAGAPLIDISSIKVDGSVTTITAPPTITTQPVPVVVATNGSCAFFIAATGFNVTYQWHRNNTTLADGGNISGATSPLLVISPAGTGDAFSGVTGYWCAVTGTGPFTTNSITNSLSLVPAQNLVWSGNGSTWDLATSANWFTNGNATIFNDGDAVTFDATPDDNGGNFSPAVSGFYIAPSSITVDSTIGYSFSGSGNLSGPTKLLYLGSGQLSLNVANSYTGGTIISNNATLLNLNNYNGLGSGTITLAKSGGQITVNQNGSAVTGINGNIDVRENFTMAFNFVGTFSGVIFGDLSGTSGKTLSFEPPATTPFTNSRVRLYGTNTVYNGNLFIDGPSTSQAQYSGNVIAPYLATGGQTYNGVISGNGGFIQRGNGTTILNGANTYSGGTTPTAGAIGFGANTVGSVTSGPIGTGPLNLAPEIPNTTGSGLVFASGGARTLANAIQYPSGTNNELLIIGGTNDLTFTGTYILSGVDALGTPTNRTIQVNNTNGLTTISGVISDLTNGVSAGFGFIKAGVGKLAFGSTETYTGPTLINGGTLAVNGALNAASAVTATNGILGGSGTVNGAVTIQNGGGIAPGNSIGTLTINNNLTIQGGSTNNFEVSKTGGTKDLVVVSGNVTYNGTLFATNLAGTLTTADSFQIFNVTGSKTGTFTNIIGSPGPGLAWSFTNSTGVLGIINGFNPGAGTNIIVSVTGGNNLNLSWGGIGWRLQVQTNSLTVGLRTNSALWSDVPNSTSVNSTNFIINPTNGTVFYRLIYP